MAPQAHVGGANRPQDANPLAEIDHETLRRRRLGSRGLLDCCLRPRPRRVGGVAQAVARPPQGDALYPRDLLGNGHGLVVTDRDGGRRPALFHGCVQLGEQRLLQSVHRPLGPGDFGHEDRLRCLG